MNGMAATAKNRFMAMLGNIRPRKLVFQTSLQRLSECFDVLPPSGKKSSGGDYLSRTAQIRATATFQHTKFDAQEAEKRGGECW